MKSLYDVEAPKTTVILSVNSDLLKQCLALNINLSATLEVALQQELAEMAGVTWAEINLTGIAAYNEFTETNGVFGNDFSEFPTQG